LRSTASKKVFFTFFVFARADFFFLKEEKTFLLVSAPDRAGRLGFASARGQKISSP
jgi:hypothetical protein